ncbi:hypothetical protein MSLAZ_1657 [Methanosarcina lacustris Z-7289]|uniref:Uncharacterized protein n=1 Tax=Methanosarcina lacustris Z-7289 TaxID=1434111 RepID=A0A0E3S7D0_9EURY|nr:hypothetical protein MSLAZ_1657 [Methanosarcina lacustris Z-7289]
MGCKKITGYVNGDNSQFFIKRGININKGYCLKHKSKIKLNTPKWGRINLLFGISGLIQERIMWNIGMTLMKKLFT